MSEVFTFDTRRSKINPQCFRCKRARTLMVDPSCDAFSDGIPMETGSIVMTMKSPTLVIMVFNLSNAL